MQLPSSPEAYKQKLMSLGVPKPLASRATAIRRRGAKTEADRKVLLAVTQILVKVIHDETT